MACTLAPLQRRWSWRHAVAGAWQTASAAASERAPQGGDVVDPKRASAEGSIARPRRSCVRTVEEGVSQRRMSHCRGVRPTAATPHSRANSACLLGGVAARGQCPGGVGRVGRGTGGVCRALTRVQTSVHTRPQPRCGVWRRSPTGRWEHTCAGSGRSGAGRSPSCAASSCAASVLEGSSLQGGPTRPGHDVHVANIAARAEQAAWRATDVMPLPVWCARRCAKVPRHVWAPRRRPLHRRLRQQSALVSGPRLAVALANGKRASHGIDDESPVSPLAGSAPPRRTLSRRTLQLITLRP